MDSSPASPTTLGAYALVLVRVRACERVRLCAFNVVGLQTFVQKNVCARACVCVCVCVFAHLRSLVRMWVRARAWCGVVWGGPP
jgi:hypothetical protein